jgi:hypothetical protein
MECFRVLIDLVVALKQHPLNRPEGCDILVRMCEYSREKVFAGSAVRTEIKYILQKLTTKIKWLAYFQLAINHFSKS